MKKNAPLILSSLIFPFFTSCQMTSKWIKSYSPDPFYTGNISSTVNGRTDFFRADGTVNVNGQEFQRLLGLASEEQDVESRNKIIGLCLLASERIGSEHIAKIPGIQSAGNVGLGTGANLTSGLAAAINPVSTKTALAAASTLFGASRELFNNEVYYNTLAPVIVKKIQDNRKTLKNAIVANMNKSIAEYSVYQALADIAEFHEASSFYSGISQVVSDASRKDSFSEKLEKLQRLEAAGANPEKIAGQMEALAEKIVDGQ